MNKGKTAPAANAAPLEWALFYASLGWAVFPIRRGTKRSFFFYPNHPGAPTKEHPEGTPYSWQAQATKDPEEVRRYWTDHPDAGIGVATGNASGGLIVLDLDKEKPEEPGKPGKASGIDHFRDWLKANGLEIKTAMQKTGGGGLQLFFTAPEESCSRGGAAAIYPGIGVDTRLSGNFAVLPPSVHPSGRRYQWGPDRDPGTLPPISAPAPILDYMKGDRGSGSASDQDKGGKALKAGEKISEGGRTAALVSYIGGLVERGGNLTGEEARRLVEAMNAEQCEPPLTAAELQREVLPALDRFKARKAAADFQTADSPEDYQERSADRLLQGFLTASDNTAEPLPTGYPSLDELLDGGLYPGLYTLGALSSLGKTTLSWNIAQNIAAAGTDVIFFTLEQSPAELIAKALSALTAELTAPDGVPQAMESDKLSWAKTQRQLQRPSAMLSMNEDERRLVLKATSVFAQYAPRIWIDAGPKPPARITAAYVRAALEEHKRQTERVPVVFLDYLQIMGGEDPRESDKTRVDNNVTLLRQIARDFGTPVFCISSLNRSSYAGKTEMAGFKESGAIEYSSDVLLALDPEEVKISSGGQQDTKRNKIATAETRRAPVRRMVLSVLKNRAGAAERGIEFEYVPMFNHFTDRGEYLEAPRAAAPKKKRTGAGMEAAAKKAILDILGSGFAPSPDPFKNLDAF